MFYLVFSQRLIRDLLSISKILGATSEYPATHALLKSTAPVVRGPQSASKSACIY